MITDCPGPSCRRWVCNHGCRMREEQEQCRRMGITHPADRGSAWDLGASSVNSEEQLRDIRENGT